MHKLLRCKVRLFLGLVISGICAETVSAQAPAFNRLDRNKDGFLTQDELPGNNRNLFRRLDQDQDGKISRVEDQQFRQRVRNNKPPQMAEGIKVTRDIPYLEDGHERQKLDIYTFENSKEKRPLVVWIHGGGWRNGSKDRCPATFLTNFGYVVASINYRLSGHAVFPAQINDCRAAIRYLKEHADEYGIDPNHVGVWGSSAGGHLVALLGTSGEVEQQGVTSRVHAVCDYYGPTELATMQEQSPKNSRMDHNAPDSPESKLLGGPVQENLEKAKEASPLNFVSEGDPPFFIVHGDQDPLVPLAQSENLKNALDKAGVECTLQVVKGGGHGPFREPERLEDVRKFFDRHLK